MPNSPGSTITRYDRVRIVYALITTFDDVDVEEASRMINLTKKEHGQLLDDFRILLSKASA